MLHLNLLLACSGMLHGALGDRLTPAQQGQGHFVALGQAAISAPCLRLAGGSAEDESERDVSPTRAAPPSSDGAGNVTDAPAPASLQPSRVRFMASRKRLGGLLPPKEEAAMQDLADEHNEMWGSEEVEIPRGPIAPTEPYCIVVPELRLASTRARHAVHRPDQLPPPGGRAGAAGEAGALSWPRREPGC